MRENRLCPRKKKSFSPPTLKVTTYRDVSLSVMPTATREPRGQSVEVRRWSSEAFVTGGTGSSITCMVPTRCGPR